MASLTFAAPGRTRLARESPAPPSTARAFASTVFSLDPDPWQLWARRLVAGSPSTAHAQAFESVVHSCMEAPAGQLAPLQAVADALTAVDSSQTAASAASRAFAAVARSAFCSRLLRGDWEGALATINCGDAVLRGRGSAGIIPPWTWLDAATMTPQRGAAHSASAGASSPSSWTSFPLERALLGQLLLHHNRLIVSVAPQTVDAGPVGGGVSRRSSALLASPPPSSRAPDGTSEAAEAAADDARHAGAALLSMLRQTLRDAVGGDGGTGTGTSTARGVGPPSHDTLAWLLRESSALADWAAERIAAAHHRRNDEGFDGESSDSSSEPTHLFAGHVAFAYWAAAATAAAHAATRPPPPPQLLHASSSSFSPAAPADETSALFWWADVCAQYACAGTLGYPSAMSALLAHQAVAGAASVTSRHKDRLPISPFFVGRVGAAPRPTSRAAASQLGLHCGRCLAGEEEEGGSAVEPDVDPDVAAAAAASTAPLRLACFVLGSAVSQAMRLSVRLAAPDADTGGNAPPDHLPVGMSDRALVLLSGPAAVTRLGAETLELGGFGSRQGDWHTPGSLTLHANDASSGPASLFRTRGHASPSDRDTVDSRGSVSPHRAPSDSRMDDDMRTEDSAVAIPAAPASLEKQEEADEPHVCVSTLALSAAALRPVTGADQDGWAPAVACELLLLAAGSRPSRPSRASSASSPAPLLLSPLQLEALCCTVETTVLAAAAAVVPPGGGTGLTLTSGVSSAQAMFSPHHRDRSPTAAGSSGSRVTHADWVVQGVEPESAGVGASRGSAPSAAPLILVDDWRCNDQLMRAYAGPAVAAASRASSVHGFSARDAVDAVGRALAAALEVRLVAAVAAAGRSSDGVRVPRKASLQRGIAAGTLRTALRLLRSAPAAGVAVAGLRECCSQLAQASAALPLLRPLADIDEEGAADNVQHSDGGGDDGQSLRRPSHPWAPLSAKVAVAALRRFAAALAPQQLEGERLRRAVLLVEAADAAGPAALAVLLANPMPQGHEVWGPACDAAFQSLAGRAASVSAAAAAATTAAAQSDLTEAWEAPAQEFPILPSLTAADPVLHAAAAGRQVMRRALHSSDEGALALLAALSASAPDSQRQGPLAGLGVLSDSAGAGGGIRGAGDAGSSGRQREPGERASLRSLFDCAALALDLVQISAAVPGPAGWAPAGLSLAELTRRALAEDSEGQAGDGEGAEATREGLRHPQHAWGRDGSSALPPPILASPLLHALQQQPASGSGGAGATADRRAHRSLAAAAVAAQRAVAAALWRAHVCDHAAAFLLSDAPDSLALLAEAPVAAMVPAALRPLLGACADAVLEVASSFLHVALDDAALPPAAAAAVAPLPWYLTRDGVATPVAAVAGAALLPRRSPGENAAAFAAVRVARLLAVTLPSCSAHPRALEALKAIVPPDAALDGASGLAELRLALRGLRAELARTEGRAAPPRAVQARPLSADPAAFCVALGAGMASHVLHAPPSELMPSPASVDEAAGTASAPASAAETYLAESSGRGPVLSSSHSAVPPPQLAYPQPLSLSQQQQPQQQQQRIAALPHYMRPTLASAAAIAVPALRDGAGTSPLSPPLGPGALPHFMRPTESSLVPPWEAPPHALGPLAAADALYGPTHPIIALLLPAAAMQAASSQQQQQHPAQQASNLWALVGTPVRQAVEDGIARAAQAAVAAAAAADARGSRARDTRGTSPDGVLRGRSVLRGSRSGSPPFSSQLRHPVPLPPQQQQQQHPRHARSPSPEAPASPVFRPQQQQPQPLLPSRAQVLLPHQQQQQQQQQGQQAGSTVVLRPSRVHLQPTAAAATPDAGSSGAGVRPLPQPLLPSQPQAPPAAPPPALQQRHTAGASGLAPPPIAGGARSHPHPSEAASAAPSAPPVQPPSRAVAAAAVAPPLRPGGAVRDAVAAEIRAVEQQQSARGRGGGGAAEDAPAASARSQQPRRAREPALLLPDSLPGDPDSLSEANQRGRPRAASPTLDSLALQWPSTARSSGGSGSGSGGGGGRTSAGASRSPSRSPRGRSPSRPASRPPSRRPPAQAAQLQPGASQEPPPPPAAEVTQQPQQQQQPAAPLPLAPMTTTLSLRLLTGGGGGGGGGRPRQPLVAASAALLPPAMLLPLAAASGGAADAPLQARPLPTGSGPQPQPRQEQQEVRGAQAAAGEVAPAPAAPPPRAAAAAAAAAAGTAAPASLPVVAVAHFASAAALLASAASASRAAPESKKESGSTAEAPHLAPSAVASAKESLATFELQLDSSRAPSARGVPGDVDSGAPESPAPHLKQPLVAAALAQPRPPVAIPTLADDAGATRPSARAAAAAAAAPGGSLVAAASLTFASPSSPDGRAAAPAFRALNDSHVAVCAAEENVMEEVAQTGGTATGPSDELLLLPLPAHEGCSSAGPAPGRDGESTGVASAAEAAAAPPPLSAALVISSVLKGEPAALGRAMAWGGGGQAAVEALPLVAATVAAAPRAPRPPAAAAAASSSASSATARELGPEFEAELEAFAAVAAARGPPARGQARPAATPAVYQREAAVSDAAKAAAALRPPAPAMMMAATLGGGLTRQALVWPPAGGDDASLAAAAPLRIRDPQLRPPPLQSAPLVSGPAFVGPSPATDAAAATTGVWGTLGHAAALAEPISDPSADEGARAVARARATLSTMTLQLDDVSAAADRLGDFYAESSAALDTRGAASMMEARRQHLVSLVSRADTLAAEADEAVAATGMAVARDRGRVPG